MRAALAGNGSQRTLHPERLWTYLLHSTEHGAFVFLLLEALLFFDYHEVELGAVKRTE